MDLQIIWFVLIAVLWIGFFVLEGFDFGVEARWDECDIFYASDGQCREFV